MDKKRILIASGGGGHFYPALSVIEALPKDVEVLVVGRKYAFEGDKALSLEYQTAESLKIPFVPLKSGRLQRKFTKKTIPSLLKLPIGFFQAFAILKKFKPSLILSFGGYISLPVITAAFLQGIPVVIHEQTLGGGLSNKIASRFAKKICISWESSRKYFPKEKTVLTGNPIKRVQSSEFRIQNLDHLPVIFVTGGSSGSHVINQLIETCISNLVQKYMVIHQTGDAKEFNDYQRLSKLRLELPENLQKRYMITKFIAPDDFSSTVSLADIIIARSGINTISEILSLGKPAILIPLPFSQDNEQLNNAQFLKNAGLGEVLEQKGLIAEKLEKTIESMFAKKEIYSAHAKKAGLLIPKDAVKRILAVIEEYF